MKGLDAVHAHYLAEQRTRAAAIVDAARAAAQEATAQARGDAARLIEDAKHQGESTAEGDTNRELASARRRARGIVLSAQRAVYDELCARSEKAVREDSRYPLLLRLIADDAQRRLGPGADVVTAEDAVTATRKHRHVHWSLGEAVGDALSGLGPELTELWR